MIFEKSRVDEADHANYDAARCNRGWASNRAGPYCCLRIAAQYSGSLHVVAVQLHHPLECRPRSTCRGNMLQARAQTWCERDKEQRGRVHAMEGEEGARMCHATESRRERMERSGARSAASAGRCRSSARWPLKLYVLLLRQISMKRTKVLHIVAVEEKTRAAASSRVDVMPRHANVV